MRARVLGAQRPFGRACAVARPAAPYPKRTMRMPGSVILWALPALSYVIVVTWLPWASPLTRPFALDVLVCRECGGAVRLLATIEVAK